MVSSSSYKTILSGHNPWDTFWGQCDASGIDLIFSINDSIAEDVTYATLYGRANAAKTGSLIENINPGK